jgi:hypothetical protein
MASLRRITTATALFVVASRVIPALSSQLLLRDEFEAVLATYQCLQEYDNVQHQEGRHEEKHARLRQEDDGFVNAGRQVRREGDIQVREGVGEFLDVWHMLRERMC